MGKRLSEKAGGRAPPSLTACGECPGLRRGEVVAGVRFGKRKIAEVSFTAYSSGMRARDMKVSKEEGCCRWRRGADERYCEVAAGVCFESTGAGSGCNEPVGWSRRGCGCWFSADVLAGCLLSLVSVEKSCWTRYAARNSVGLWGGDLERVSLGCGPILHSSERPCFCRKEVFEGEGGLV